MNFVPTPDAVRAESERRGEPAAVEDAAGGDDRDAVTDCIDDLRHECHGRDGARVAAGLRSLGDDEVASGFDRGDRVPDLAAHRADEDVVLVQQIDHFARHAEASNEDRSTAFDHRLDARVDLMR